MPWWGWVLIAAGAVALGMVKLSVFRTMMRRKQAKKTFKDED